MGVTWETCHYAGICRMFALPDRLEHPPLHPTPFERTQ